MSMTPEIENKLKGFEAFEGQLFELSKEMLSAGQGLYPLDNFAIGVINRSLALISGFVLLIRNSNYIGAAHLTRPHLDNYLRFYAAWQVSDPHDFAMQTMKGVRIEKLKDRNGNSLKDSNLIKTASLDYPWMQNVYDQTSGFTHLSSKHILTSGKLLDQEKRTIELAVSKFDKYVEDESRSEAIDCMSEITRCIIKLLVGWIWTKNNEDKLEELRKHSG
jgi:hypothetical protein